MVRDIFGVPISTVPSESAFSTGGRVLDAFRSSLTPGIVEALICSGDWLRSNNATVMSQEEDLEELAELENVALACAVAIDDGEVNQTTTGAGIEVDLDDGEEYSSDNMNDDWDNVINCSGSEEEY